MAQSIKCQKSCHRIMAGILTFILFPMEMPEPAGTGRFAPRRDLLLPPDKDGSAPHFLFRKENGPRPVQKKTFLLTGIALAIQPSAQRLSPSALPHRSLSALRRAAAAVVEARDLRRTGRQHQKAAQVSRAAKSGASAGSASAGISAEAVPRPRAARERQAPRMAAPV